MSDTKEGDDTMGVDSKAVVAEFVGTFLFFFIGAGAIIANTYSHGSVGLLGIALAHGLVLSIVISAFGATSGGHFNPAVTLAFLSVRRINLATAFSYIVAQLAAGTLSGLALRAIFPTAIWQVSHLGTPNLAVGVSVGTGVLVEAILTFLLLTAVFGTAVDPRAPKIGGFGIGLAIMVDILVGGPLTGAAMNPARVFGPALAGGGFDNQWVYWVGPIIGAVLAALLYETVIMPKQAPTNS